MNRDVDLFVLHFLGALDGDEARAVAARVANPSDDDRAAIAEAEAVLVAMAHGAPAATPPKGGRDRLLASARAERSTGASRPSPRTETLPRPETTPRADVTPRADGGVSPSSRAAPPSASRVSRSTAIFAGVLFLLLAGLQIISTLSNTSRSDLHDRMVAVATDPTSTRWTLTETGKPDGHPMAVAFLNEKENAIVVGASNLPAIKSDQMYVLWAIEKGPNPTPRNLMAFKSGGDAMAMMTNAPMPRDLTALAISVETNPKTAKPTTVVASGGS